VLERIVAVFYIPWVFWGAPLLLAALIEVQRAWRLRRDQRDRGSG